MFFAVLCWEKKKKKILQALRGCAGAPLAHRARPSVRARSLPTLFCLLFSALGSAEVVVGLVFWGRLRGGGLSLFFFFEKGGGGGLG